MADAPAGPASRFEDDLRAIRAAHGVELADLQQDTRIPADVLDRFESGGLVGDPNYNEVYLKNLLKAYAHAINVAPSEVIAAYDAQKAGSYRGELRRYLGDDAAAAPGGGAPEPRAGEPVGKEQPPVGPPPQSGPPEKAPPEKAPPEKAPGPPPAGKAPAAAPAVAALRDAEEPRARPVAPAKPEKSRVRSRESVTSSTSAIESSWGLIIAGTLIALLVIGGALWLMVRPDRPEVEAVEAPVTAVPEEDAEAPPDEDPAEPAPATDAPRLETPIQVTVIAAEGAMGGAGGFRVTEEPDVRRPYWLEEGTEQTFSSDSMVIIWGTGANEQFGIPPETRLRLQGYEWSPTPGAVLRIDRQRGQALLDSLHRVQGRPAS